MNKYAVERHIRRLTGQDNKFHLFYDTFLWNWYSHIRKLGRYIRRLIIWSKVLWKDENWDYRYVIRILIFKLEDIRQEILIDPLHVETKRKAQQIQLTIEHLKRYMDIYEYKDYKNYFEAEAMENKHLEKAFRLMSRYMKRWWV